jgi:hypothetical protein
MCFFYVVVSVKITVRDLEKYVLGCLLAPKSNVQTANCSRLARLGAESVTTFTSGVISVNARFVLSQIATSACSSV